MESIRSIKIDLNSTELSHIICGLLEKLCFLMVDWARQSLYFKDIKVRFFEFLIYYKIDFISVFECEYSSLIISIKYIKLSL